MALFTAWNTARLSTFHDGKLRPISYELSNLRPREPRKQSSDEMLAALRAIKETMAGAAHLPEIES